MSLSLKRFLDIFVGLYSPSKIRFAIKNIK